jgi:small GTP-binding protein
MFDQNLLKLIVIGDSAVGKTQMMFRFTDDTFTANALMTIGVDFKTKEIQIDGVGYRIQIWDTAGQERFRNITEAYYRRAHGIAIVFDVSDSSSFDNVPGWFESVNAKCNVNDAIPIVLVANKCDLDPQVTFEQGLELANQHGAGFHQTSAKNGTGIEEAFMDLATRVAKNNEAKRPVNASTGNTVDVQSNQPPEVKKKSRC